MHLEHIKFAVEKKTHIFGKTLVSNHVDYLQSLKWQKLFENILHWFYAKVSSGY